MHGLEYCFSPVPYPRTVTACHKRIGRVFPRNAGTACRRAGCSCSVRVESRRGHGAERSHDIGIHEPIGHGEHAAAPGADEHDPPCQSLEMPPLCPPPELDDFPRAHLVHEVEASKA